MRPFLTPLTVRDCADYLGFTTEWIRRAITDGVNVHGVLLKLEAETLTFNKRRTYRIHLDKFTQFLRAIGWKHLPARGDVTNGPARVQVLDPRQNKRTG
jgi:hypothetical protein